MDNEQLPPPMTRDEILLFYKRMNSELAWLGHDWLSEDTMHAAVTIACLHVLENRDLRDLPALRYAQWHWPYHARLAGANDIAGLQGALTRFLDPANETFKQWSREICNGDAGLHDEDPQWSIQGMASDIQLDVKASVSDFPQPLLAICQWNLESQLNDALTRLDLRALNGMHNCRGETPLCIAVKNESRHMVEQLLAYGADPNVAPRIVRCLDFAAEKGNVGLAQLLIDHGARIHARGKHGLTPLQTAAKHGSVEIAALLIDNGADVNVNTSARHEETPLQLASGSGHLDMVSFLLINGAEITSKHSDESAIVQAARSGHAPIVQRLLDESHTSNEIPFVHNALFVAVQNRHLHTAKLLLGRNADANFTGSEKSGTALIAASLNGDYKLMQILIEHGADVNQFCEPYKTALAAVAERRCWDLHAAEILLCNGARLHKGGAGDAFEALNPLFDARGRMRALFESYASAKHENPRINKAKL